MDYLEKAKELLLKKKKTLIKSFSVLFIVGIVVVLSSGAFIYSKAKSNINYNVDESKKIALQAINGEVVGVKKSIEIDTISFEYEFKIKDSNNILNEVTVDSKFGVITDVENYYD